MDAIGILILLAKVIFAIAVPAVFVPLLIYLERKVVAWIQIRVGPNRVGPQGVMQPLADALKLMVKEDITPTSVDKFVYTIAPVLMLIPALITFVIVPWGPPSDAQGFPGSTLVGADLNVGVLFYLAVTSLGIYGIVLAGWSSNNKYSLMGGLRSSAQMLSYEISMGLSILPVLLVTGSLRLSDIIDAQQGCWFCIPLFVAFITYFITGIAETNRAPFDLPEAESELVAGYHTEYSSFKFAMFFMGEYANMVTVAALTTTLFLGGWRLPWVAALGIVGTILQILGFFAKVLCILFIFFWLRATLPRFRYDQLMYFGWKVLLPVALTNVVVTAIVFVFLPPPGVITGPTGPVSRLDIFSPFVLVMFLTQVVIFIGALYLSSLHMNQTRRGIRLVDPSREQTRVA